jgi:hypothetical protein
MLSSQGASFNSSQRVIKNGKVVVTSSDGDDTDSISSMEDPDELLRKFTSSSTPEAQRSVISPERPSRPLSKAARNKKLSSLTAIPTYKYSLESLVTDAVDDNETEAGIAKIRQIFEPAETDADVAPRKGDQGLKGVSIMRC